MSETVITPLRPKAKDPTGAQRQARFRKKRKAVVTVQRSASAGTLAPAPIAHPTLCPSPLSGKDAPVGRNGGAAIDFAAYTAAIALAGAAAYFSIRGMTVLFPGAPLAIIGMAVSMEGAKLVTAGWLARRWRTIAWVSRLVLVALVAGLALINAAGVYAQLVAAHVGERRAAASQLESKDAALGARIELASHAVADLDRRLNQVDITIEEAAKRGKTNTAFAAIEAQRKAREALVAQRQREASTLADLKTERASLGAEGKQIEAEAAPIRYVAELLGVGADSEQVIGGL